MNWPQYTVLIIYGIGACLHLTDYLTKSISFARLGVQILFVSLWLWVLGEGGFWSGI